MSDSLADPHRRAPITDEGDVIVFWWCDTTGQRTRDCSVCRALEGES